MTNRLMSNAPLVVTLLLLVDSLHFVFARLLRPYLPPAMAAFFVLGVAGVETAVFLAATRRINLAVLWRHWRFFVAIGVLVAVSTTLNYTAVLYIDPGTASLLGQTSTVFALAISIFWLRERLNRLEVAGALVARNGRNWSLLAPDEKEALFGRRCSDKRSPIKNSQRSFPL